MRSRMVESVRFESVAGDFGVVVVVALPPLRLVTGPLPGICSEICISAGAVLSGGAGIVWESMELGRVGKASVEGFRLKGACCCCR